MNDLRIVMFLVAALVVGILVGVVSWFAKDGRAGSRWFVLQLIDGEDGRLSTSKCQALIWTLLTAFGLIEVLLERAWRGDSDIDPTVPVNLLIAMGMSVTTAAFAKGIAVSYSNRGLIDRPAMRNHQRPQTGGLVTDDDGNPDLSKIQIFAFTMIAIAVYLFHLMTQSAYQPVLVDIEPAMMVLMGLSHGAYLGKKVTTVEPARISGINPASGRVGTPVEIQGANFGDGQGYTLLVDDVPAKITAWKDSTITFDLPSAHVNGAPLTAGDRLPIVATINGREVRCPVMFVVS